MSKGGKGERMSCLKGWVEDNFGMLATGNLQVATNLLVKSALFSSSFWCWIMSFWG